MTRPRIRRMRRVGGTPVEEAPIWALAILAVLFCLVLFPALVGLLNGLRLVSGGGWTVAAAAGVVSVLLVVGLARQRPWKRTTSAEKSFVERPFFVRFSTWIWVTLIIPNVLYGILVLTRGGEGLDYLESWLIGGLVSVIHGGFALAERWRRRERCPPPRRPHPFRRRRPRDHGLRRALRSAVRLSGRRPRSRR